MLIDTDVPQTIEVKSNAFGPNQMIPHEFSDYGESISPALIWSGVPKEAQSLVLVVEDPDAPRAMPFVHWVMYNIPASAAGVPADLPNDLRMSQPPGALQGKNSAGEIGYMGPRPPVGDKPHHYHFEVLALDAKLPLTPGADCTQVAAAIRDHVIAKGELVGVFEEAE